MDWKVGQKVIVSEAPDPQRLRAWDKVSVVQNVFEADGGVRVDGDVYPADGVQKCERYVNHKLLAIDDATAERLEDERRARPLVLQALKLLEVDEQTPCPLTHAQAVQLLRWLAGSQ